MKKNVIVYSVLFAFMVALPVVAQESGSGQNPEQGLSQRGALPESDVNCRGESYDQWTKRRADCFANQRELKGDRKNRRFEQMGQGPRFECPQDRHRHRVACRTERREHHAPYCFDERRHYRR